MSDSPSIVLRAQIVGDSLRPLECVGLEDIVHEGAIFQPMAVSEEAIGFVDVINSNVIILDVTTGTYVTLPVPGTPIQWSEYHAAPGFAVVYAPDGLRVFSTGSGLRLFTYPAGETLPWPVTIGVTEDGGVTLFDFRPAWDPATDTCHLVGERAERVVRRMCWSEDRWTDSVVISVQKGQRVTRRVRHVWVTAYDQYLQSLGLEPEARQDLVDHTVIGTEVFELQGVVVLRDGRVWLRRPARVRWRGDPLQVTHDGVGTSSYTRIESDGLSKATVSVVDNVRVREQIGSMIVGESQDEMGRTSVMIYRER